MTDFLYYNRNPDKHILKDCVCRAISTVTSLKYEAVDNLLEITADLYDCDKLCVCCYDYLLTDTLCYERIDCDFDYTVSEVMSLYPRNKLIIRIDRHLTASIYGTLLDLWDCLDERVDCFWIVD